MRLNELSIGKGSRQSRCRVGRGLGTGQGKTSRRGQKGQKSRSGAKILTGFEGGQMPLYRRLPKRGFKSRTAALKAEVNLASLKRAIDSGKISVSETIDEAVLRRAGLVGRSKLHVKIIGRSEVPANLSINIGAITKGAAEVIAAAGGTIVTPDHEEVAPTD